MHKKLSVLGQVNSIQKFGDSGLKVNGSPHNIQVKGKFIIVNNDKFIIKGVTYGTFRPDENGIQYPGPDIIEKDFSLMNLHGINTVRTYTVPPVHLLNIAQQKGIKVMVGLPWEQHITFLDSRERQQMIIDRVTKAVIECANHPAVLCYTIGNEIPASIVRWYGAKAIEKFLHQLYKTVKGIDNRALVTYVNYPTTEFLHLPFLDFHCFNVYLETKEKLDQYLQRLHNLAGDTPLVLAEIGLDSMRNGLEKQSEVLDWQLKTIFAKGCAGAFVFAWTDEWWRGGYDIEDWDFGLVDRERRPKPALFSVSQAFSEIPFSSSAALPFISVVVCSRNGSASIRDCMEGLMKLDYPHFELIVINDGSTDNLASIVSEYPVKLISTTNQGLSNARNRGMMEASGEIVAYIDDDAYPDRYWLRYLAYAFTTSGHAGIGGPNIAPDDDGPIATAVANSPGGPIHVLLSDEIAEHIPGCNMAFRKNALLAVGGFDPIYRAAGDDVDLCWRIQHSGRTIGFHPSAMVWHHRRNSIKAYWKQQVGYGKAEALLENKWPEKYNEFGHVSWSGRIYGNGVTLPIKLIKDKIFHGVWGTAPFQSIYQSAPASFSSIPLMPEWHLLITVLGILSILGIFWQPLLLAIPFFIAAVIIVIYQSGISARKAVALLKTSNNSSRSTFFMLITFLHILQPVARLYGRILYGLTPWRKRGSGENFTFFLLKHRFELTYWSEKWKPAEEWLSQIEASLIQSRSRVKRGGHFDQWDLQTDCGVFSAARGMLTIEEHGGGKQMLKFRCWPKYSKSGIILIVLFAGLAFSAALDQAYFITVFLGSISLMLIIKYLTDTAKGLCEIQRAFMLLSADNITLSENVRVAEEPLVPELLPQFIAENNNIRSTTKVIKTVFRKDEIPVEHKN